MLRVNSFLVSPESFPPYRYVRQYVPDLLERYVDLAGRISINESLDSPKFDFLYVHICENGSVLKLSEINDIISAQALNCETYIAKDKLITLETFLDNFKKTHTPDVSVVIISDDSWAKDEVRLPQDRYKNTLFVLIDADQKTAADANPTPVNGTGKDYALATCNSENRNGERRISHLEHKELQDVDRDTIESLFAEMTALFRTSNVPEHEKPNVVCNQKTEINKQLKRELFEAVPTIERMGYRFSKFVVYVGKDTEAKNDNEREAIKRKIQEVLCNFYIKYFTVEFISKGITTYCDVRVGAKIKSTPDTGEPISGTLGCFVNKRGHEASNMCALISGHVARGRDCFCFYSETTESFHILGNVDKKTVPQDGVIDIAALTLKSGIKICAKFRKEQDNADHKISHLLPGKLKQNSGDGCTDDLELGQYVYIWGALSKPGKGVVTMRSEGMDDTLIQIEDRRAKRGETSVPFCKPGDSGAIICAEDRNGKFVHVIAMLMGKIESQDENADQIVGKYLSVPLCDGLCELASRTGCSFEICGCEDN